MILSIFTTIILIFYSNGKENELQVVDSTNSFIIGTWQGQEKINIKAGLFNVTVLADIEINFGNDDSFNLYVSSDELDGLGIDYQSALQEYKRKKNLDYDSYELIKEEGQMDFFTLRLYNQTDENESYHNLEKISNQEIILQIVLDNGSEKDIVLWK